MTIQTSPYLRNQRNFPNDDVKTLSVENDRAYIDIASKVNSRTIGLFAINVQAITGERWYLQGSSLGQQTLRQVYQFGSIPSGGPPELIPHGIKFDSVSTFTVIRGIGFNASANRYFPLPFVNSTAANGQIEIFVDSININILSGATAPALDSGFILLEWLSIY